MSASLWEVIGPGEITDDEESMLDQILHATLSNHADVANAFIVNEEQELLAEITVFCVARRNVILAHIFELPARVVVAQFKDWLADNIEEDGTVVPPLVVEDDFDRQLRAFVEGAVFDPA